MSANESANLPSVEPARSVDRGESTRAVHLPAVDPPAQRLLGQNVSRSSTFAFDTAADYAAVLADASAGYVYSRYDNPTVDAFALGMAALEGHGLDHPVAGQAFASGMAAISSVLMTLVGAGGHVLAPAAVYGGTYALLNRVLSRFGVRTTYADLTDPQAAATAIRPDTALIWAETIANPTTAVADIPGLAAVAREAGIPLVVDSTFASPAVCRPLEHGATVVVHSATKYLGGHSDVTGGVAVGPVELMGVIRATRIDLGGSLSPDDAFLLRRGLTTLPLRVSQHSRTALAVATAIASHPAVERVDYPGLPTHPQHEVARKLFLADPPGGDGGGGIRFGGVMTITPRGGRPAGMALCDGLALAAIATSLGGTHSVVSHVASTTHRQFDDAALRAAGISPGSVRFSIGLESADDLVADIGTALDRLPA
jgi:cystathionine beta-lyase/cystathionine gamma-synthase